jgi:signal transduction histidine kinase
VRVDVVTLLDRLTELVELANAGEGGLAGLQAAVELASAASGAVGGTFVEYGRGGGRVVAATEAMDWALGRPLSLDNPSVVRSMAGPPVQDLGVDELADDTRRMFIGHGLTRVLRASASADGVLVGALNLCFTDPDERADGFQRAVIHLLAACAAHLYRESAGLPVYPDGPALPSLAQGMAVVGPDAAVRSWSPAAERLTGRAFEAAIGRPLPFPVPPAERAIVHRIDPGRWIRAKASALVGTDATVVTFREIAEPQPGEQARDLFVAVTSHELRTPVTVIKGYADTLVERWDDLGDADRREAMRVIGQRAGELARLVDRLLRSASDVAGLVEGGGGVPFELVDALRAAAGDLGEDLRRDLRLELPPALPKAFGDRPGLVTVLTELVTNAFKYSPERVDVQLTAGADAQTVWFRVADRGLGIRPEHTERAFERFWQLDSGDQRRYGGVGLGLYLVRRIVERQNGWVSLRPRDGGGTVAEVRLPRADASGEGA